MDMAQFRLMASALVAVLSVSAPASAQVWPARTITLVVPFAAGGGVDVSARIQAQKIA